MNPTSRPVNRPTPAYRHPDGSVHRENSGIHCIHIKTWWKCNIWLYYKNSPPIINTALIAHRIVQINQPPLNLAVVHIEWLIRTCPKSNPNVNCSFLNRVSQFITLRYIISATGFHDNMLNQQNLCSWLFS